MAAMTTAPSTAMRGRRLFILLVLAVAAAMGRAEAADPRAEPEPATPGARRHRRRPGAGAPPYDDAGDDAGAPPHDRRRQSAGGAGGA